MLINEQIKQAIQNPGLHWIVAPSYRQVKSIIWTRLKALLKNDPDWKFNEQELYAEEVCRGTRLELRGADNEDSLRGVGLKSVGLDECAMMKANVWPEIIRPMLADNKGPAMFISTPKGRNWFYDLYLKGVNKEPNWESWQFQTNINKYILEEELAQAKKDMSERLYKQEFEAEFIEDDIGVFKRIRSCVVGELKDPIIGRYYVLGADLAKSEDFTVLTVIDSITREIVAFERFQDISWLEQKLRIQKLAGKYNNALVILDSTGVGDPIFEDLQRSNISIEGFKFTNESKSQLVEQLAIAIEQRQITFPRIDVLIEELMNYEYSITDYGRIKYSAPEGKHDDCVTSLALAVWGIRNFLHSAAVLASIPDKDLVDRVGMGEPLIDYSRGELVSNYTGY